MIDTNVAIHLRDGHPAIAVRLRELDDDAFLSAVSRVELEGGVVTQPKLAKRRREGLQALLEVLPVIDFDFEMAEAYGAVLETTGFSRRKIIDRMIAATALVQGLTLITVNGDDFRDVPGLELLVWDAQ